MKIGYQRKSEWVISGKSFLRERENHPVLVVVKFSGIWEMTGIIEKIISLVIWDPNGTSKNREYPGQVKIPALTFTDIVKSHYIFIGENKFPRGGKGMIGR